MKSLVIAVSALCLAAPVAVNAQKVLTGQMVSAKKAQQIDLTLLENTPATGSTQVVTTFEVEAVVDGGGAVKTGSAASVTPVKTTVVVIEDEDTNCLTTLTASNTADDDTIAGSFEETCDGVSVDKGAFNLNAVSVQ